MEFPAITLACCVEYERTGRVHTHDKPSKLRAVNCELPAEWKIVYCIHLHHNSAEVTPN